MRSRKNISTAAAFSFLLFLSACGEKGGGGGGEASLQVEAGQDLSIRLGATAELEGSVPAAASPRFLWEVLARPEGSEAGIADAEMVTASFLPDVAGDYELQLTAWDGKKKGSGSLTLTVVSNRQPLASTGEDLVAPVGSQVELDGTASADPDRDPISMVWSFLQRPDGSSASLGNPSSRTPRFIADLPGVYEVELLVSDGAWEVRDTVRIRGNRSPIADAGGDKQLPIGNEVQLDGSGSQDPDGDPLVYEWTMVSRPGPSSASLSDFSAALGRFTPDLEGAYTLELKVSDGFEEATDRVVVVITAPGGFLGSVVYVSPEGDDEDLGTKDLPLATLGAAIAKAVGNQDIKRIQLAEGVYDDEPYGYSISRDLDIAGPDGEEEIAILEGAGQLFELSGSARLSLSRLALQTNDVAIYSRGTETTVSLTKVVCEAFVCVESGREEDQTYGGSVNIRDSQLIGTGNSGSGVGMVMAKNLLIVDSTVANFRSGVNLWDTKALLSNNDIAENQSGLVTYQISAADGVLVENCRFEDNGDAIVSSQSAGVTIQDTMLVAGGNGLDVHSSAVLLQNVLVSGSNGIGLVVRGSSSSTEVVTLRDSRFSSIAGPAISIEGKGSSLDLGTQDVPGGNSIDSNGWPVVDMRPVGATGVVSMRETRLGRDGVKPKAGTYTGPYTYAGDLFRIQASGNKVFVR